MPSGLAMTILGANHQVKDDRDDKALQKTLEAIKKELDSNFKCKVPGTPHDDLFEDYSDARKTNFLDNLDLFVEDAKEAVEVEKNQLKASRLWQKHLGDKFPDGEDVDMDKKEKELKALKASILSNTAYSQKDNTITEDSSGVKNQPHKNYGG
ncbi:hypothetical protein JCM19296_45 [Nonlabens ulvanivorans]|uniref:Uncharacterized protein n=1 Tax=Nonlabens ulvanivorans TaxID=906888 RepID=A0A081D6C1_NONUL|nr:hypothetical protein [Nonlabens ulvanivorans]GAK74467.1 hypothetical protein JCM19296_45 [Nonlabens ulvanivorans]